jgi:hypothetical protein
MAQDRYELLQQLAATTAGRLQEHNHVFAVLTHADIQLQYHLQDEAVALMAQDRYELLQQLARLEQRPELLAPHTAHLKAPVV